MENPMTPLPAELWEEMTYRNHKVRVLKEYVERLKKAERKEAFLKELDAIGAETLSEQERIARLMAAWLKCTREL
jgi:hypothetical protein